EAGAGAAIAALLAVVGDDSTLAFEREVPVARGDLEIAEGRDVALELQYLVDLAGLAAGCGGVDPYRKLPRGRQPHHHAVGRGLAGRVGAAIGALERLRLQRRDDEKDQRGNGAAPGSRWDSHAMGWAS